MSKVLSVLLSSACIAFSSLSHSATTLISFDDIAVGWPGFVSPPSVYKGLSWVNVSVMNPFAFEAQTGWRNSGAANGMVSLSNIAFNNGASFAPIQFSAATPFTFNSAYFTGVWNDGLTLTAKGLSGGIIVDTTSFTVDTSGPILKTFNWTNLDSVVISASGGTRNTALSGNGTHLSGTGPFFAFDNMIINGPVAAIPEASTYAMMLAGLGILGIAGLRRKKA